jgi:hypothetical protein
VTHGGHYYELLRLRSDVLEQAVDAVLALLPSAQRALVLARVGWDDTPPQAGAAPPPTAVSSVGVPYQATSPTIPAAPAAAYQMDPDKVGRGIQGHGATLAALAETVRAQNLKPLQHGKGNPPYDLAWETQTTIFVAEVKSLTPANAEHQLRLGLGQVLRYWHAMTHHDKSVVAVLAVEQQPIDPSWLALCERLGVHLVWPEVMPQVIARLCEQSPV